MQPSLLHPRAVTTADFPAAVLAASHERPVLVDFWAPWCGPCKAYGPILESVARAEADRADVVKVDVDEEPELATRYQIRALPTVVIFHRGAEVDRLVGLQNAPAVQERLARLLSVSGAPSAAPSA